MCNLMIFCIIGLIVEPKLGDQLLLWPKWLEQWRTTALDIGHIFGYLAAILTTLSFLPQTIKTIKEKNTEGISLLMYGMFTAGVFLWLVYGLFMRDIPIIVSNGVTFALAVTILILKIKYTFIIRNES